MNTPLAHSLRFATGLGASLLAAAALNAAVITVGFDTGNPAVTFTEIRSHQVAGVTFENPGFDNFTDLEVVPNDLPAWHETLNHPALVKASGNAVSGLAVDLGYLGAGSFDLVALDGTVARLFARVDVDSFGGLTFNGLDPATYNPASYPVPEPGALAGSLVMLAAAGGFVLRRRRQAAV